MRIYTGRGCLLAPAMIEILKRAMNGEAENHIVVVPKQLTLQTERSLLAALNLRGSFQLQVLSPERLCGRIFDVAGKPEGARIDDRGRALLVRAAINAAGDRLSLYRTANSRRGFSDRCARQLELIRQAGLSPESLRACAESAEGMLAMKLTDLSIILEEYEKLLEGRYQDGESEFNFAISRAKKADFLRRSEVFFFGFDLTPPTLLNLMAATGAVCPEVSVFLPLENDEAARDFDAFIPVKNNFKRLWQSCRMAGVQAERVCVEAGETFETTPGKLTVVAPAQRPELSRLERELFAFPIKADQAQTPPGCIQMARLRNPLEECCFAAALCRRMAMQRGWRWRDILILCRDVEAYHQPLREAFRSYDIPIFLSSNRSAARHPLAECLLSALKLADASPRMEDLFALMHTGYMPIEMDEGDRLSNYIIKYGLKPYQIFRALRRGSEAEIQEMEPIRARFIQPVNDLKIRFKKAADLKEQLTAIFEFLTDTDAAQRITAHMNRLIEADMREQAGEEGQVWNRIIGALDQMAALMNEKLTLRELRECLSESLEAAIIKPLPQSDDAIYAQSSERVVAQPFKGILILGVTDKTGGEEEGLLSNGQKQALARFTHAYVGADDGELSRMRRFYLKSAIGMAQDYICITSPMSDMDNSPQHPGALMALVKNIFPGIEIRGGITEDEKVRWMMRATPEAALAYGAKALSAMGEGTPLPEADTAALASLSRIAQNIPSEQAGLERLKIALSHGESAERLNPGTAKALYGAIRKISVTKLERFAQCPFAYFTQYGLKPEKREPYQLNARDEGSFFHAAVHEFMLASMNDLNSMDISEAEKRMDGIADRLLDVMTAQGPLGNSAVENAERRRLKATVRTCAGVLTEHMRESKFAPAALESDFGPGDGTAQLTVNAATGQCTLEGRIDRIDEWLEGGYLRVIDYKRGGKDMELDAVYHGLSMQLPAYLAAAMKKRGKNSAGVYYFNLDEGILALQTTDKNEVEKKRRSQFRLSGIVPEDLEVLKAISPAFPEVLNARATKEGTLYKGTLATDANGFRAIMNRALEKAGEHLDAIRTGVADIAPVSFRQRTPCAWCDWRSVCLFDNRMDAACVRRFKTMKGEAVMEALKTGKAPQKDGE